MTSEPDGGCPNSELLLRPEYRYRDCDRETCNQMVQLGFRRAGTFPHRILYLRRSGPDGFKLASRMYGFTDPSAMYQVQLYADPALLVEFPASLFFDDDIVWHQQQLGMTGQIATANLILAGEELYGTLRLSDVVQRIGRRREFKTRVENLFAGWNDMLLNAILSFAWERGAARVHFPNSALAMRNTDRKRVVQKELFERVYDRAVQRLFSVKAEGNTWIVDVAANRGRFAPLREATGELRALENIVCIGHDTERGLGHAGIDPVLSGTPDSVFEGRLDRMLAMERGAGVRSTYNVVGCLLEEVRRRIAGDGHCLAFHSYDHAPDTPQLYPCRTVDYRLKGYRPPRSVITRELTDENLCHHNFEWLASSAVSFGTQVPVLRNGIARIPIAFDDFALHTRRLDYTEWERRALGRARTGPVLAFSVHDCYADHWLDGYPRFLDRLRATGELLTFNELSGRIVLTHAE
jgi:hypothetical protein